MRAANASRRAQQFKSLNLLPNWVTFYYNHCTRVLRSPSELGLDWKYLASSTAGPGLQGLKHPKFLFVERLNVRSAQ